MAAAVERANGTVSEKRSPSFEDLLRRIPEAISFAGIETESLREAKTPEGKFALTYLLATRNVLRPALDDLHAVNPDLLRPVGGPEYNPERTIDEVGAEIARHLGRQTTDIPNLWIRLEESGRWECAGSDTALAEGKRFAVIDPFDMTNSIKKGDRVQTSGIAFYDREGTLLTAGIMSMVDDTFVFIEKTGDGYSVYPPALAAEKQKQTVSDPIRVATLTRRMHALRDTPLFANNHASWDIDCTSGYAVLSLLQGHIDAVVDPFKGNPWYENVIWYAIAQALGYLVTDKDGNTIDYSQIMRTVAKQLTGNGHRTPAIVSRTPEIHKRVLELLKKPNES